MGVKKTKAEWETICKEWAKSGLSQRNYCDQKAINLHAFKYHMKRWQNQGSGADIKPQKKDLQKRPGTMTFSKVKIGKTEPVEIHKSPYCKIIFENGETVSIESESSLIGLKQLMSVQ